MNDHEDAARGPARPRRPLIVRTVKIRRAGNSIGVTIPKEFEELLGYTVGESVAVVSTPSGEIRILREENAWAFIQQQHGEDGA